MQNVIETQVQTFWNMSLAWKRVPGYVEHVTVGDVLTSLASLKKAPAKHLAAQADDLTTMAVKGRIRRKKRKGSISILPTTPITNNQVITEAA